MKAIDHAEADAKRSYARAWTIAPEHIQGAGVVQGGVLAGMLAETLQAFATSLVAADLTVRIETLETAFHRPTAAGEVVASARLIRHGRTLLQFEGEIVDGAGRLLVNARSTHAVRPGTKS